MSITTAPMQARHIVVILILAVLFIGCRASRGQVEPDGELTEEILLDHLRQQGYTPQHRGPATQSFLTATGTEYYVGTVDVFQIFEYRSEASAEMDARKIDPTGLQQGLPPQLYHQGRLIVIYYGDNLTFERTLEDVLGPSVAF